MSRSTPAQGRSLLRQEIAVSARFRGLDPWGLGRWGRRGSFTPRPAHPRVRGQALRPPRRAERELVPSKGRLPPGGDVELGLTDDLVALVDISPEVPPEIRDKVAQEAARLREEERTEGFRGG